MLTRYIELKRREEGSSGSSAAKNGGYLRPFGPKTVVLSSSDASAGLALVLASSGTLGVSVEVVKKPRVLRVCARGHQQVLPTRGRRGCKRHPEAEGEREQE